MRPIALVLLVAATASAAPRAPRHPAAPPSPAPVLPVSIDLEDYTLPNGLRVVLSPDHSAPTVAVAVYYDVGSRNEKPAEAGYAHLIEHLLGKEPSPDSLNLPARAPQAKPAVHGPLPCDGPSDFTRRFADLGGEASATTTPDATVLFEEVPSPELERALWIEGERMRSLAVDDARLATARGSIRAERRTIAGPGARAATRVRQLAYQNFGWSHATPGAEADLDRATPATVNAFWASYYGPSNAVLVVRGDFASAQVRVLVNRYFADLPRRPAPPAADLADPDPTVEKYAHLRDPEAVDPIVTVAYRIPPARSADWYALDLLGAALGAGDSARLVDRFAEQGIARSIEVGIDLDRQRGPGLFELVATAAPGHTATEVRKRIDEELDRVRKDGISERELGRARSRLAASLFGGLETHLGAALRLGEFALFYGDPRKLRDQLGRYDAVTLADVERVAQRYFVPAHRVVVELDPGAEVASPTTAATTAATPATQASGDGRLAPATAASPVTAVNGRASAAAPPLAGKPEPATAPLTDVAFPKVRSSRLSNGLGLRIVERPGMPLIDLSLVVAAGSADDPAASAGRAALVANLLHEGTTTRSRDQLEDDIESIGGDLTSTVDAHATRLATRALAPQLDRALALLADVALHPAFTDAAFESARGRMVDALAFAEADPRFLAERVAAEQLFPAPTGSAPSAVTEPTRASLAALTREAVLRYHAERFHPGDATIIVVGDVRSTEVAALVRKAFGAWKGAAHPLPAAIEIPSRKQTALQLIERASPRASWRLDLALPARDLPLLVAAELLAGSPKLPCGAHVELDTRRFAAQLTVAGRLPAGDLAPSLVALMDELSRLGREPPAPADLAAARERLLGRFAREVASPEGLARLIAADAAVPTAAGAPAEGAATFAARLRKVDGSAVKNAAERWLAPTRAVVVVVGPKELAPSLAPLGKWAREP